MIPKLAILCMLMCSALPMPFDEDDVEAVEPEYLDQLLEEKRYEEFNRLMGIDVPHLSKPRENVTSDPRFSKHLEHGDILLRPWQKEQDRQGINWNSYPSMKWTGNYVPYTISGDYTAKEKAEIERGISQFNSDVGRCFQWKPRSKESSYVYIFSGDGCYSNLGRVGKQQPLSLSKYGCIYVGTVVHEILHAMGFVHEQCRSDRDDYITVYFDNINPDWRSQYYKYSSEDVWNLVPYDYYSTMHYPQYHSDVSNDKPAYKVLDSKIDAKRIGSAQRFTDSDIKKVFYSYCP